MSARPENDGMGALSFVAAALTIAGVVLALLIAPILLVWPRAWAHLVPRRRRGSFVRRPTALTAAVTLALAIWAAAAMSPLILASGDPDRPASQKATAVVLVWLIFGGLTAAAVARALRIGIAEWAIVCQPPTSPRSTWPTATLPSTPPAQQMPTRLGELSDQRPARHRPDRVLRNATRWLAAGGLTWYLLGRGAQLGRHGADAPSWWWTGTVGLLVVGAAVWTARRVRWRADGRRQSLTSPGSSFDTVLHEAGLAVHRPAGPWVADWAPLAFVPDHAITGPALWPWAGTGVINGLPVLVAAQHGQFRNSTGLTGGRTRTACAIRMHGTRLPRVVIAERESIPPQQRHTSIPLESESFNRSLWVYGPDARGVYDIVHPRVMAHALRELPDGATVAMSGETLAVVSDEPVSPSQLRQTMAFAVRLAELTPTYLRVNSCR